MLAGIDQAIAITERRDPCAELTNTVGPVLISLCQHDRGTARLGSRRFDSVTLPLLFILLFLLAVVPTFILLFIRRSPVTPTASRQPREARR
jgi:hypothetical protein